MEKVAEGFYCAIASGVPYTIANSVVIVGDDAVAVVDTGTGPNDARVLLGEDALRKRRQAALACHRRTGPPGGEHVVACPTSDFGISGRGAGPATQTRSHRRHMVRSLL
jgi:hypothetical protein